MNAPAKITVEDAIPVCEAERAYRAAISIHCPNENEFRMACRVDIASMRDRASKGLNRCSDAAYAVLSEVARQATQAVYADLSTKKLMQTRWALTLAMEAARALERANK